MQHQRCTSKPQSRLSIVETEGETEAPVPQTCTCYRPELKIVQLPILLPCTCEKNVFRLPKYGFSATLSVQPVTTGVSPDISRIKCDYSGGPISHMVLMIFGPRWLILRKEIKILQMQNAACMVCPSLCFKILYQLTDWAKTGRNWQAC